jgi:colanic acid/amylovoran biosynthesis protein
MTPGLRPTLAHWYKDSISGPLIVIADGWLGNAGDAAILLAMRRSLTRAISGARLVFCCHQHRLVGDRYPELELAPPLECLVRDDLPWTDERDFAERESVQRLVDAADLVIAPGGGFLYEHYNPESRFTTYEALLERGKRLVFYSQSIGEFSDPALRERLAAIFRASALVLVRDQISYDTARGWGGIEDLALTADEAFLLSARRRRFARGGRALLAAVSMHPWWTGSNGALWLEDSDMKAVAESLTRLLERRVFNRITFASTTQGLGGPRWALEDDYDAAQAVVAQMPAELSGKLHVVPGYVSAGQYMQLATKHSAVISMRMHGAILAAVSETPTLLVNAGAKVQWARTPGAPVFETIQERADLGRLDVRLEGLLAERRRWKEEQQRAVTGMRRLADANARLVAAAL